MIQADSDPDCCIKSIGLSTKHHLITVIKHKSAAMRDHDNTSDLNRMQDSSESSMGDIDTYNIHSLRLHRCKVVDA